MGLTHPYLKPRPPLFSKTLIRDINSKQFLLLERGCCSSKTNMVPRTTKYIYILLFGPAPSPLRFPERARKFPGLVNGCTINWFLSWPTEALVAVSNGFIGNAPIECSAEVSRSVGSLLFLSWGVGVVMLMFKGDQSEI